MDSLDNVTIALTGRYIIFKNSKLIFSLSIHSPIFFSKLVPQVFMPKVVSPVLPSMTPQKQVNKSHGPAVPQYKFSHGLHPGLLET